MATRKLSTAQQALIAAITGKTLTFRIVSLWRGGASTRSLFDVKIGGEKPEIKVRLATIEALQATGDVILTCVDCDNKEYTVTLPAPEVQEAQEVETPEATEAPEAQEAQVATAEVEAPAPATEAPELKIAALEEEIGLFYSLIKEGQYVLAEAVILKLIDDTAADDKIHRHSLGTILIAQGKKEEAKKVYYALYESYRHDNRLHEARQPLWEIILNCPDSTAYTLLGKTCEDLQEYLYAIAVYTHAIGDMGTCEDYLYGLHRAYLAIGEEAKAQEYLEHARRLVDEREIAMGRCIPVPAHKRHIGE